jgi:ribosomal protein S18 acetylase RimI-like enzyme
MIPLTAVGQVFDAIQATKMGASAFCTNFFPVESKLQAWIDHAELQAEQRGKSVFFVRKDRGFYHLYFCAADMDTLRRDMVALPILQSERVSVDIIGREGTLEGLLSVGASAGFRRYSQLLRLVRTSELARLEASRGDVPVAKADPSDVPALLDLLESSFDPFADQLPMPYEVKAAAVADQILAVKSDSMVAAFLMFETQGFTSTVRYWVVAERFRSQRFGGALIRQYFASHPGVRRFILWVTADNENAIQKYRHYGYVPDGLVDHVLVNPMVSS